MITIDEKPDTLTAVVPDINFISTNSSLNSPTMKIFLRSVFSFIVKNIINV